MSPLRLSGSISGYSEIEAPANAGSEIFTLPGTGGTLDRLNRAGNILQVVNTITGSSATGTTTIPNDDTIPQNTEGTEFMTLAITPTSASSKLLIQVIAQVTNSVAGNVFVALFQDSTANAIAAQAIYQGGSTGYNTFAINHYMTAGTTSSTTFKVRAGGGAASTTTFNGTGGNRALGGAFASSITITEIAA